MLTFCFSKLCRGPEYSIFVGDLTPDVNDSMLQVCSLQFVGYKIKSIRV